MTHRFLQLVVLLAFSLSCIPYGNGQDFPAYIDDVNPVFQKAVDSYSSGDFDAAVKGFDRVLREFPLNQRTTASYLMKGKAQLRNGEGLDAARTLRTFLSTHPESSYRADAEYNLGLAFLSTERFDAAVSTLLTAWEHLEQPGSGGRLERDVVSALDAVIDSTYNVVRIRNHLQDVSGRTQRAYLWIKVAGKHARNAELALAGVALDSSETRYPTPSLQPRIAALRAQVERRSEVKIGVLLPLMSKLAGSPVRQIGEDLLAGIEAALKEHNSAPTVRTHVSLVVRDTERDPLVATRIAQELTSDPEIIGIIGPVFSNTTSAVVGLANARKIPLLSPTANSNGIAAVGPYIFQANPDYETRGIAMARFAVLNRGHKRLAVLAPIDTYAKFMAEAFMSEATRLGAELVASEWYQRGETDFTMQLRNIRRATMVTLAPPMIAFSGALSRQEIATLVHLGVPMSRIDSLLERSAVVDAVSLLGPNAAQLLDSAGVDITIETERLDSLEYPAEGIDGFYVPVSMPEEIGLVSSQIVYFNFVTELLGSGEWNNFTELDANKRYCRNVFFDADSYTEAEDPAYGAFVDRYYEAHRQRPSNHVLFGYDTGRLVLSLISTGATQRESLRKALGGVREFRGLHSRIGFSSRRVNTWLQVLQFDGERVLRVDELSIE
ncbi:MAG: ABC transporter substrate-binding protein [Ignavibacteria bacterium]|nr:ABC transporter substrate-binding protein [Ignavibacteria bacterium]